MDYGLTGNHAIIPANTVTQTARAFTGHEQIKEISGLIHSERLTNDNSLSFLVSNARVYDSDIGRFLSADTLIQDPHDSQSYNRYSYARNNPLVFMDPSGHSWLSKLWHKVKKYIRTIASIVVAAVLVMATGGVGIFANSWIAGAWAGTFGTGIGATIATGALAGFASGAIMTGSLKGALTGALWGGIGAGLAFGIGHMIGLGGAGNLFTKGVNAGKLFIKSALHGLSRGIISMAQGGTFKSGFASGFSSSFFSPGTTIGSDSLGDTGGFGLRTSIAAIVGGTASKLGGGKFSNGAVSGAFVHMFNAEQALMGKGTDWDNYKPTKEVRMYSGFRYLADKESWIDGLRNVRTASVVGTYGSAIALQPEGVVFFTATRLTSDYMITQLGGQDDVAIYRHSFIDVATSVFPTTSIVPAGLLLRVYTKKSGDSYAN